MKTWKGTVISRPGITRIGNIEVKAGIHTNQTQDHNHVMHCKRYIEIRSFCNDYNCESGLAGIKFPNVDKRPDLWQVNICDRNLLHMWGKRKLRKRFTETSHLGQSAESTHILDELEHDIIQIDMHDTDSILDNVSENFLVTDCGHIRNLLLTTHKHILIEMLFSLLCGKRTDKWSSFDPESLYDTVLLTSKSIYIEMTAHEIDGILKILQNSACKECPLVLPKYLKKLGKSNLLAFLLGHTKRHFAPKRKKITIDSLSNLCQFEIKRSVPEDVIRVGLAAWKFNIDLNIWLNNSPVGITLDMPVAPYTFDIFSYPDISEVRSQVESRIIDPSHCLMNLRLHATQKGFFGCDPKAFLRVSEVDNNVLNKAFLVQPIPDKQLVLFAEKVFSAQVEQIMRNNADMKEAELVKNIRNWYDACNKRGLQLTERIKYLINMNNYMLSFYDSSYFPMNTTHVKGLPSTTFQSILQNISTRLQLYSLSGQKTYNHRAISTLAVESMFSALSSLCQNSSGIPLAAKIPRYISRITQFTSIQQNPNK